MLVWLATLGQGGWASDYIHISFEGDSPMTLQVISSGFGRTGTMTLKVVLEHLGFGPTHHMVEVLHSPQQQAIWQSVFRGEEVDWENAFDGFSSQVDFPGSAYWRETMQAFPQAKIIHTERPEEDWWASFNGTIGKSLRLMDTLPVPPEFKTFFADVREHLMKKVMVDYCDKQTAIAAYRENNSKVRELVPSDRLLVFDVADGWEPLCRFLDVEVPAGAFPHHHVRSEFWQHFGGEPA